MSAESAHDRTLVLGDPVVTLAEAGVVADGAVLVDGSRIAEIGPRADLAGRYRDAEVIGAPDGVVLPGLVNAHFHSDFHLDARWLRHPMERGSVHVRGLDMDAEQLYWRTIERAVACLRAGQTTVLDVVYGVAGLEYLGLPAVLGAYRDLGMRAAVAVALRDRQHYVHGSDAAFLARLPEGLADRVQWAGLGCRRPVEASLRAFEAMHADGWGKRERTRLLLAPDWTPSVSDALYRRAAELAAGTGTLLTGHLAETRLELQHSLDAHGKTPVRRLADLGVLHPRSSWAHATWSTDDDLRVLAASGTVAIVNPGSNLRMGAGIPRAAAMRAAGVAVGLGTDGMALYPEDLLGEACLAAYLDRDFGSVTEEPLDPMDLLAAAQGAGARAAGFGPDVGALRVGGAADLVVLRPPAGRDGATPLPRGGYALVERLRDATVVATLVDGERILADGQPVRLDADERGARRRDLVAAPPQHDAWASAPEVSRVLDRCTAAHYEDWVLRPVEPAVVPNARALEERPWS